MIPRKLHVYWGGQNLSWLRYMTVVTFKRHNPNWEVILHKPVSSVTFKVEWNTGEQSCQYTNKCWLSELEKECTVRSVNMEDHGWSNEINEVYKSDFIRNYVLFSEGGIWSDLDIIYHKPVPSDLLNNTVIICNSGNTHYIGFLGGSKNNSYYKDIYIDLKNNGRMSGKYQNLGSAYLTERFKKVGLKEYSSEKILNIDMDLVYSVPWNRVVKLTEGFVPPEGAIGIHWFGGSKQTTKWETKLETTNTLYGLIKNEN